MMCAWKPLMALLPVWLRQDVDRLGKENLQELRLRIAAPAELVLRSGSLWLNRPVCQEDLSYCINAASQYSPWSAATAAKGYLTAEGGHRIGLCGEAVIREGRVAGIRNVSSLCIRIARDFSGIGQGAPLHGSVLIIGAPGWGKTTLLRELARRRAQQQQVSVVDERGEVFPAGFSRGKRMDILTSTPKAEGIHMVLRTMGPDCIAVDEITEEADALGLLQAKGCGTDLLATAHASSIEDFYSRPVYAPLISHHVFDTVLVLRPDKTFRAERMMK